MMSETCDASDSRLPRRDCWCAECRDERREAARLLSVRPVDDEWTRWIVTVSK
jgi:hypothetical protein